MVPSDSRWYFTKEQLNDSPSRKAGMDADKEMSYRNQAANLIQDMGDRLKVTQLCVNTAIVYMHRFYCHHSFTRFHFTTIASAALLLAAKNEDQPRKVQHIIHEAQICLRKGQLSAELYKEKANELIVNENIMLMTLGFDLAIEHPHAFIVELCQIANLNKELSQASYVMASISLQLTTMCLQYKPTVVACVSIHLSCQWSGWQIPKSKDQLPWYYYIDSSVTVELLEQLTTKLLEMYEKYPSRLKQKIQNCLRGRNSMGGYIIDADRKHLSNHNQQHPQASTSSSSASSSSTKAIMAAPSSVVNGSRMRPLSSNVPDNVANKLPNANNAVIPPSTARSSSSHPPPPYSGGPPKHHPYGTTNPTGVLPISAIKPHPAATGPSNSNSSHASSSGNHNVFTKYVGQRVEQVKKFPVAIKYKPIPMSDVNNNHSVNKPSHVPIGSSLRKETSLPPSMKQERQVPPPPIRPGSFPDQNYISNVLKEVSEKQRLNSTVKSEPMNTDVKPPVETLIPKLSSKKRSIFSPLPVGDDSSVEFSLRDDSIVNTSVKPKPLSPECKKIHACNLSSSSSEGELKPIVKKMDGVIAGYKDIFNKPLVSVSEFEASSQQESKEERSSNKESSHSHKKKKHKEKDKKYDKERHRHKEKKKHRDDKHRKDHKEKLSKEHKPVATPEPVEERNPERINITIPKERLDAKTTEDKMKSSRKRHRESDHDEPAKRHKFNGSR